jgi:hypothetical protein
MQAIEDKNEVVIAARKFLRGDLEADSIDHTFPLSGSSRQLDGFIVVVKSVKF